MRTPRPPEADPSRGRRSEPSSPRPFEPDALPPGTRLDEFEIVRVLGAGGFGIVYLALDLQLQRQVAIKEFIPGALAGRTAKGRVEVRSPEAAETFAIGLESFYNEGRLLARFDHPSLVRVFRFWKANGTAYMAMQYYPGQTLKEARAAMPGPPDEAWLRTFVDRLLGALGTLHAEGVYHRDIAPDNILLLPDGQPVILDFGSARRVISDHTQSLTAILKPNYSPVEQYVVDAGMRQGGYTDLYALGGTVYFMIAGRDPIPAVMRAVRDSFPVLARVPDAPFISLSTDFLAVVDWALAVAPEDRPQTVEEVRAALSGQTVPPEPRERSGVLIAEPGQVYDPQRAMAKTQLATRRLDVAPTTNPVASVRARPGHRWLMPGLAVGACAAVVWALAGAPHFPVAEAQPAPPVGTASAAARLSAPASAPASALDSVPSGAPPASAVTVGAAASDLPAAVGSGAPPASAVTASSPRAASARPTPTRPGPSAADVPSQAGAPPEAATRPVAPVRSTAATTAPAPKAAVGPAQPASELCAGLGLFARASCLGRVCAVPSSASHPQCVEARRLTEQRERRMDQ